MDFSHQIRVYGVSAQSLFKCLALCFRSSRNYSEHMVPKQQSFFFTCLLLISYIYMTVLSKTPAILFETISILSVLLPINAVWLSFFRKRGASSALTEGIRLS